LGLTWFPEGASGARGEVGVVRRSREASHHREVDERG